MRKVAFSALLAVSSWGASQTVQYGDVSLVTSPGFARNVQDKAVVLQSADKSLGMYVFCADSRTANVSIFIPNKDFTVYGYRNDAVVPVTWQADQRRKVTENWRVIGQNDDLRRYGQLGLITAELFNTKKVFTVNIFESKYVFPAQGINTALRKLPCIVPFLKGLGYNTQ